MWAVKKRVDMHALTILNQCYACSHIINTIIESLLARQLSSSVFVYIGKVLSSSWCYVRDNYVENIMFWRVLTLLKTTWQQDDLRSFI